MMQAEEYRTISEEKIWYADRNKLERMLRSAVNTNNRNWMYSPPWTCLDEINWNFFLSIYELTHLPIEHWLRHDNSQLALILTHCVWSSDRFSRFFTSEYDITRRITTQNGCYPTGRTLYMGIFVRDFWSTILRPPDDFLGQQGCSEWLNGSKYQVLRWSMP